MSRNPASYREVIEKTLEMIPEIRVAYEQEVTRWTDERMGPYNLFDIVLMPHVKDLLEKGRHEKELRRIFRYFEELAGHPEKEISNLVAVAVCEDLCSDEAALQQAQRFLGPKTKHLCQALLEG